MTMLTVMTMFLIYPFTLSHEHRHHRHHRHAYSEMTLAVYYCSKQKQWCYEKCKIRMTQMRLMTLNLGYGIGISSKQRHKRHQRHYRHTRTVPGVWGTPQKCVCGYPNAMLAKHILSQGVSNQTGHPYKFVYISEWITFDSFKNPDSKKWIRSDSLSKVLLLFPFLHARGHHGDALFSGNGVTHLLKWQEKTRI